MLKTHKSSFSKNKKVLATLNIIEDALFDKFLDKVPRKTKKNESESDVYFNAMIKIIPLPWCA